MRKIARRDRNHLLIVEAFRRMGCSVLDLAAVGNGCPDLLVARRNSMRLIEIKNDKQIPSKRRLTEDQARFHALWNGHVSVVMDQSDVARVVNSL